jgi:hypothetical protein
MSLAVAGQCRARCRCVKAVLLAFGEHDAVGPAAHEGVGTAAAW